MAQNNISRSTNDSAAPPPEPNNCHAGFKTETCQNRQ
jgi:hypothetical protein